MCSARHTRVARVHTGYAPRMDDDLKRAGERFLAAARAKDPSSAPLDESKLAGVEEYLGRPIPPAWREVLLAFGTGPRGVRFAWPDSTGMFHLGVDDAAEHQVETDDGIGIAGAGGHVLGYIEGIGDCVVLDAEGQVQHHGHSGSDAQLGTLPDLLNELAKRLESGDDLVER